MCGHHWTKRSVFEHVGHGQSPSFSLVGVSRLVFLSVSGSIWEVSLNIPSVNCLSKLDVGSCQRPQCRRPRTLHVNVREERGSTAHDVWWTNFRSFFDKTVAFCSPELVNEHIDRRQWVQSTSMGAWSIFASPFSALLSCVTVSISPTTP